MVEVVVLEREWVGIDPSFIGDKHEAGRRPVGQVVRDPRVATRALSELPLA